MVRLREQDTGNVTVAYSSFMRLSVASARIIARPFAVIM
jgi:hypothetical protein